MTLAITHVHNLPPHFSYVSPLPDITQKPKSYAVFLLIGKAASVFQRLRPIWTSCVVSIATKIWLYNSIVVSVASYASETWKMTARIEHKLNVFHQRCLRKILKVAYKDHITNEEILLWANSRKLSDIVTEHRFRMAGHILRLPDHRAAIVAISWIPVDGRLKIGRPNKTWRITFQQDLQMVDFKWQEVEYVATDRSKRRQAAARCAQRHGMN